MNQKGRTYFAVLCLFVFMMQGCSQTEKNVSAPPPASSTRKAGTTHEAPVNTVPDNQPAPAKRVDLTPDKLKEMISINKDLVILDVRNPDELVSGPAPLANAVNIPLPELSKRYTELTRDKDIVVVCRSGHRSAAAADFLIQAGFSKIYSLDGGMTAYRASEK